MKVSNVNTSLLPVSLFAGVSDKTGINNVVDNVTAVWLRLSRVSPPSRLDLSAVFSRYGQDRDRGSCMQLRTLTVESGEVDLQHMHLLVRFLAI